MELLEKLHAFSVKNEVSGCVEWIKGKTKAGYGQMHVPKSGRNGVPVYCHVIAYKEIHGDIPQGMYVLHKCDNRACVNPDHLFLGTHLDNILDMLEKRRQPKGQDKTQSKLRDTDVFGIYEKHEQGVTMYKMAKDLMVSYSTVYDIVRGKTWKHLYAIRHRISESV